MIILLVPSTGEVCVCVCVCVCVFVCLLQIAVRYDILLIQEIRDSKGLAIEKLRLRIKQWEIQFWHLCHISL